LGAQNFGFAANFPKNVFLGPKWMRCSGAKCLASYRSTLQHVVIGLRVANRKSHKYDTHGITDHANFSFAISLNYLNWTSFEWHFSVI